MIDPIVPARLRVSALIALISVAACHGGAGAPPAKASATGTDSVAPLRESWMTTRDTLDNIDSPAVWHGPDGQHWVLSTAKTTNVLVVNDASTGDFIRRLGASGTGRGQMQRPNGIAIAGNLAFVVERDNHRVQVSVGEDDVLRRAVVEQQPCLPGARRDQKDEGDGRLHPR